MSASQVVELFAGTSMACPCGGSGFLLVWMGVVAWLFAAGRMDLCLGALRLLLVMVLELGGADDGCRGPARRVGWVVSPLDGVGCRVRIGVVAWSFAAGRIDLCLGALGLLLVMVLELVGADDGCRGPARRLFHNWVGWDAE